MSVICADDYGGYGLNQLLMLNGLWAALGDDTRIVADPDPLANGRVLKLFNYTSNARRVFPNGAETTVGFAQRIWMPNLPPARPGSILRMLDGASNVLGNVVVTSAGFLEIWKGQVRITGTDVPVLTANAWHHLEVKFVAGAGATGAFEARVEGVTVLEADNIDIGDAFYQFDQFGGAANQNFQLGCNHYSKDMVCWNGRGAKHNDFFGTVQVIGRTTSADESLGGWIPSHGATGFNLLDNSPPDDGVDYLTAPFPPPDPMSYDLSALPPNISSVRALITQVRARKIDGGDGNIQSSLISSGDTVDGADRPITTAFTYYEDVFETDPHTGQDWTPASAEAAQLQINRTV